MIRFFQPTVKTLGRAVAYRPRITFSDKSDKLLSLLTVFSLRGSLFSKEKKDKPVYFFWETNYSIPNVHYWKFKLYNPGVSSYKLDWKIRDTITFNLNLNPNWHNFNRPFAQWFESWIPKRLETFVPIVRPPQTQALSLRQSLSAHLLHQEPTEPLNYSLLGLIDPKLLTVGNIKHYFLQIRTIRSDGSIDLETRYFGTNIREMYAMVKAAQRDRHEAAVHTVITQSAARGGVYVEWAQEMKATFSGIIVPAGDYKWANHGTNIVNDFIKSASGKMEDGRVPTLKDCTTAFAAIKQHTGWSSVHLYRSHFAGASPAKDTIVYLAGIPNPANLPPGRYQISGGIPSANPITQVEDLCFLMEGRSILPFLITAIRCSAPFYCDRWAYAFHNSWPTSWINPEIRSKFLVDLVEFIFIITLSYLIAIAQFHNVTSILVLVNAPLTIMAMSLLLMFAVVRRLDAIPHKTKPWYTYFSLVCY